MDIDNFDKIFDEIDKIISSGFYGGIQTGRSNRKYPTEVTQDRSNIFVTLSLGNIQKDDVFITLSDDILTIRILAEDGEYERNINLTGKVKPKSVKTTFINGVLDITIKKR